MRPVSSAPPAARSTVRRIVGSLLAIGTAAVIAAGCGGDGGSGGGDGQSGLVGDDGPLAWLPSDTWLVASANTDPDAIDEAVKTLGRLPIWALAEGFLPASDGPGLRRELLREFAKGASEGSDQKLTGKELEDAFGNHLGIAVMDNDFSTFDQQHAPVVVWIDVDDKDAADKAIRKLAGGSKIEEKSHHGVDYLYTPDDKSAALVDDDRAFIAPNVEALETVIDTHEGDGDSLADDDTGRAVIEGAIGDAFGGVAVQTDPVLAGIPDAVNAASKDSSSEDAAKAKLIAAKLGPLLTSDEVDGLVPDWVGGAITIDDVGLRVRGAWSNPRDLATPDIGSRELLERMPAESAGAGAMVSDGTSIERIQDAWAATKDAYDLDLRQLADDNCTPDVQWACDLGVEVALTALEDEDLAKASKDSGDHSIAYVEDIAPLLAMSSPAATGPKTPAGRFIEVATTGDPIEWTPPKSLLDAAAKAGIVVTTKADHSATTVSITPGSPVAKVFSQNRAQLVPVLQLLGIDVSRLESKQGVTFGSTDVDGIRVFGLPMNAPSKVEPALKGDIDTIGDAEHYKATVKAAKPPKDVGYYYFTDVPAYVDSILAAVGGTDQDIQRIMPTVRNNLSNVPGILTWSTRAKVRGHEIGVVEGVVPITD